jgi:hypothetical protein
VEINAEKRYPEWAVLSGLTAFYCIAEFLINPIGNFPLNDEWWYATTLRIQHYEGVFDGATWGSATLLTQLWLGKIFITLFGLSFTTLRFCTLLVSLMGLFYFYLLLRKRIAMSQRTAIFFSLLFLFNPLYLCLSNSYMTDVYFAAFSLGGLYYYLGYRENNKTGYLAVAFVFLLCALFERQLALALFIGIACAEWFANRRYWLVALSVLLPVICLYCFEYWLHSKGEYNQYRYMFFPSGSGDTFDVARRFVKRWTYYAVYTGLFLSPLLLPYLISYFRRKKYRENKNTLLIAIVLFIGVCWTYWEFPLDNYILNTGIGPETSYDTYVLKVNRQHAASPLLFSVISVLAYVSAFAVLLLMVKMIRETYAALKGKVNDSFRVLLLVSMSFYYAFLCFTPAMFDRYILFFAILFLLLVAHEFPIKLSRLAYVLLASMMVFATAGTRDYLAGHRARWEAIDELKSSAKVTDAVINGGYEHTGHYFFDASETWSHKWVHNKGNDFLIAFGPMEGHILHSYTTYQRWMPWKQDTIFILKRVSEEI